MDVKFSMALLIILKGENKENKGILRDKRMDDKLIYITNDNKQNDPFCRLKLLV